MARRLRWTPCAVGDLDRILEFIAKDAPSYARAVHLRIQARIASLPGQPGQGRRVPEDEGGDELREVIVQSWRVIYRTRADAVVIVAIVHSAPLLKNVPPL